MPETVNDYCHVDEIIAAVRLSSRAILRKLKALSCPRKTSYAQHVGRPRQYYKMSGMPEEWQTLVLKYRSEHPRSETELRTIDLGGRVRMKRKANKIARRRRIKAEMALRGITCAQVARELSVSQPHVTQVTHCRRYTQRVVDALVGRGIPRDLFVKEDPYSDEERRLLHFQGIIEDTEDSEKNTLPKAQGY